MITPISTISILNIAKIYTFFSLLVVAFQLALAAGAPWGKVSMGGKFPGVYPSRMRIAAIVMAVFFLLLTTIVCIRAAWLETSLFELSRIAIWVVVAINGLGLLMNLITPSKWERIIWSPVCLVLLYCSTVVGLS
jgi:hypothetical protein